MYYQVMACPLLCLPLIFLLIRIKMSRLMEHSNTFYHFLIWMEILGIAFMILNSVSFLLDGINLGDLQYVNTFLRFFLRLLFLSSSFIIPPLAASAVPKTPRIWDELLFRSLLLLSLVLPASIYFLILIMTKDETLPQIDIRNIEFTIRLIDVLSSSLISLTTIPILIYGAVHVEWTGVSK
ncbi:hypothetical protein PENTCL1PPCAC_26688, partial [Pristionchus entomophagus]